MLNYLNSLITAHEILVKVLIVLFVILNVLGKHCKHVGDELTFAYMKSSHEGFKRLFCSFGVDKHKKTVNARFNILILKKIYQSMVIFVDFTYLAVSSC